MRNRDRYDLNNLEYYEDDGMLFVLEHRKTYDEVVAHLRMNPVESPEDIFGRWLDTDDDDDKAEEQTKIFTPIRM